MSSRSMIIVALLLGTGCITPADSGHKLATQQKIFARAPWWLPWAGEAHKDFDDGWLMDLIDRLQAETDAANIAFHASLNPELIVAPPAQHRGNLGSGAFSNDPLEFTIINIGSSSVPIDALLLGTLSPSIGGVKETDFHPLSPGSFSMTIEIIVGGTPSPATLPVSLAPNDRLKATATWTLAQAVLGRFRVMSGAATAANAEFAIHF